VGARAFGSRALGAMAALTKSWHKPRMPEQSDSDYFRTSIEKIAEYQRRIAIAEEKNLSQLMTIEQSVTYLLTQIEYVKRRQEELAALREESRSFTQSIADKDSAS
jgi:hypothetical protein